jgi:hypothetical protein
MIGKGARMGKAHTKAYNDQSVSALLYSGAREISQALAYFHETYPAW